MSTSYAQKESRAIREQMNHIRSRMPYSMDAARAEARQLLDWKFYVGRFPTATLGAAAALGYLLVPTRKRIVAPDAKQLRKLAAQHALVVAQQPGAERRRPSPLQLVMNMGINMLLRAAMAFAGQQVGRVMGVDLHKATR